MKTEKTKMAKHNKKRNVGLIHEQLVRYVASSLIAEDKKSAEVAIQIIADNFKKGTELYKEFRLFNAMINLPVGTKSLAERVLLESKNAAKSHDSQKIRVQKSKLIKDINTKLTESRRFYSMKISNYKLYATVQTLLNEWRGKSTLDLTEKAKYEESVVEWLSREVTGKKIEEAKSDPLVQRLMYQKFEEKYKEQLSETQKAVLQSSILGSDEEFIAIIKETKKSALSSLAKFEKTCDNKLLRENISSVVDRVRNLPEQKTDDVVAKTLHLIHLIEEMGTNE
tara:strand:+ start:5835 stop:6680 length:846 start_codon:yes stop_codon:yes gene_type:complete